MDWPEPPELPFVVEPDPDTLLETRAAARPAMRETVALMAAAMCAVERR